MHHRLLTAVVAFAAASAAQNYVVTPLPYATQQGNATNPIPFYNSNARYQQIHGDLRGTPRLLQGMSLRRGNVNQATANARTCDLTVVLANSDITRVSPTFAANYAAAPATVRARAPINFPDWTASGGTPEPWSLVVPFGTPFVYVGQADLLWEWVLENNTSTQTYAADVYSGITADLLNFANVAVGTACTATGQTMPMNFGPRCYTSRALNGLYFRGTALYGAANSPSVIALGLSNPNLAIPGLCTNVHTDMLVTFPSTSSNIGSFTMPDVLVPYNPGWQGLKLYSQAISTDLGQPGLPFALSAGVENTIGGMQPVGVSPVVRIFDIASATSAAGIVNFYAYGLIVRFTH